jgi:hypothetical protein
MNDEFSKKTDNLLKSASSYFTLLGPDGHLFRWILPVLGAGAFGYSAFLSKIIAPFGLIGWVFLAFIGAVMTASILWIVEGARLARAKRLDPEKYASGILDDRLNWAKGISVMSIRDVACAIAGVLPREFENSGRAQAIATEIRSRVNDGWIPTDTETSESRSGGVIVEILGKPNFEKKAVELHQTVYVGDVEHFCTRKDWNFSWAHEAALPKTRGLVTIGPQ